MTPSNTKILLVGSIPPPYHGQAVITEILFRSFTDSPSIEKLNLSFSPSIESIGTLGLKKLWVLFKAIFHFISFRLRNLSSNTVLYYCAGSANWVPLIKDCILLGLFGRLFNKVAVHYHSGGLPEWFEQSKIAGFFGKLTYGRVNKAIALTSHVKVPCYKNTELYIVPNGLNVDRKVSAEHSSQIEFLFLGALRESKGIGTLCKALKILKETSDDNLWKVNLVGEWVSLEEEHQWINFIKENKLEDQIYLKGRLTGLKKWEIYKRSDVFVFPSFYESENQPLVIIEAMGMGLPIIASNWRGIPELLEEGKTGYLIPPQDANELANIMQQLISNPEKLEEMSVLAKKSYDQNFTESCFIERITQCITVW